MNDYCKISESLITNTFSWYYPDVFIDCEWRSDFCKELQLLFTGSHLHHNESYNKSHYAWALANLVLYVLDISVTLYQRRLREDDYPWGFLGFKLLVEISAAESHCSSDVLFSKQQQLLHRKSRYSCLQRKKLYSLKSRWRLCRSVQNSKCM